MAAPNPWTDDETKLLLTLHGQGKSLHAIAKDMGRGKATISKRAREAGLNFDRTATAKAAEAVSVDNKARRAKIVARMYARMEHLQDRLEAPQWTSILKGSFGVEEAKTLAFVPTRDERDVADIMSRYTVATARLEAVDHDGSEQVRSLLGGIAEALGLLPDHDA